MPNGPETIFGSRTVISAPPAGPGVSWIPSCQRSQWCPKRCENPSKYQKTTFLSGHQGARTDPDTTPNGPETTFLAPGWWFLAARSPGVHWNFVGRGWGRFQVRRRAPRTSPPGVLWPGREGGGVEWGAGWVEIRQKDGTLTFWSGHQGAGTDPDTTPNGPETTFLALERWFLAARSPGRPPRRVENPSKR